MISELLRLLRQCKHFLSWTDAERAMLVNLILLALVLPLWALVTIRYPAIVPHVAAFTAVLLALMVANLRDIQMGRTQTWVSWVQVVFIAAMMGFLASVVGSVSSGVVAFGIFLTLAFYPLGGIRMTVVLGFLNFLAVGGVITMDFILEIWPYYWVRDMAGIGHSGNEVREILALTKPGKLALEGVFLSCLIWTILMIRSFDRQMNQKNKALIVAEKEVRHKGEQAEQMFHQSEQQKAMLESEIEALLGTVQSVSAGNLNPVMPEINHPLLHRLEDGFADMIEKLRNKEEAERKSKQVQANQTEQILSIQNEVKAITQELNHTSQSLVQISTQMEQASQQTLSQAEKVASEDENMQSHILTMSRSLNEISDSLKQTDQTFEEFVKTAENSARYTKQANSTVHNLGKQSSQVGRIVEMIDQISQQTHTLALNASIQAMKAGAAGQGFGVVAKEVGQLAAQATQATQEIGDQLEEIKSEVHQAVDEIEKVFSLSEAMNTKLEQIQSSMTSLRGVVFETSEHMEQTANGAEAIAHNISSVQQVAQDARQNVQLSKDTIAEVDGIVQHLNQLLAD